MSLTRRPFATALFALLLNFALGASSPRQATAQQASPAPISQTAASEQKQPHLLAVLFTPRQAKAGKAVQLTVMLTRPAPKGGIAVRLQSSDPKTLLLPKNVTIPEGTVSLGLSLTPRAAAATAMRGAAIKKPVRVEVTGSYERLGDKLLVTRKSTLTVNP